MYCVKLPTKLRLLVFITGGGVVDLRDRVGDLTIDALPFPNAVLDRIAVTATVRCVHAFAVVILLVGVVVALRARGDRGGGEREISSAMLLVTDGARDASGLVGLCVRRVKTLGRVAFDARVVDRLVCR